MPDLTAENIGNIVPPATAAPSRRLSLKAATETMHRTLDAQVAALDLGTTRDYRQFLLASAAALIGVERLLERAGVRMLFPDWAQRSRSQAILADLRLLDATVKPFELRRTTPSTAEVFGMMYVLEGSRLGARYLLRQVLQTSHAAAGPATAYLSASHPSLWHSFLSLLEASPDADDQAATTAGAIYTFAVFERAFANLARRVVV